MLLNALGGRAEHQQSYGAPTARSVRGEPGIRQIVLQAIINYRDCQREIADSVVTRRRGGRKKISEAKVEASAPTGIDVAIEGRNGAK